MKLFGVIALLGAASVAACNITNDIPPSPRAVFTVTANPAGGGTFTISPTAIFLNGVNLQLPDSRILTDSCEVRPYPLAAPPPFSFRGIDPGSPVTVQTGGTSGVLVPDTTETGVTYMLQGTPLPFSPGNDVSVAIPGSATGFPAATLTASTPAVYSFSPVDTLPNGPLTVRWSGATGTSTAMILSLPYSVTPGAAAPDQQIYCAVPDTGATVIPADQTIAWQGANPGTRHLESYKFHTTYLPVAPSAGVLVIAHLSQNYPSLP